MSYLWCISCMYTCSVLVKCWKFQLSGDTMNFLISRPSAQFQCSAQHINRAYLIQRPSDQTRTYTNFSSMWPCIVTNFFVIKPTRCTNSKNLFFSWNSICFGEFLCPSSGVYSLYTQQWYMTDSFRAGPGWNCSSILVLPQSCLQTCMIHTIAECTVNKLLMIDRGTVWNM